MDSNLTTQFLEEALANVNVTLVVVLMAIGFIIKHFKIFEKVENNVIPPILLVFSVVALSINNGFSIPTVITAVINAAVAIGLHQQGKNIFTVTVIPAVSDLINNLLQKEDTPVHENEFEMEVDETIEIEE